MDRRTFAKIIAASGAALAGLHPASAAAQQASTTATQKDIAMMKTEALPLVQEWDKTFKPSDKVTHSKATFVNRFGITLAADVYIPKDAEGKRRVLLTIAFDPSYTGESGGQPRYVNSPDINTEDFSAAVDYLSTRSDVDAQRIGIIGICGWGGFALNAAAIDPRIKATVASTMYDMSRATAKGYFDEGDSAAARQKMRAALAQQRIEDYKSGSYKRAGGVVDPLPEDAPFFVKDYYAYYKTPRGYHKRSLNSNEGWNVTAALSLLNAPLLHYSDEIESAALLIHGEKAHSVYFSRDAFKKLKGDNKELLIIPGAVHTDLYDRTDIIPFDKMAAFFTQYLK